MSELRVQKKINPKDKDSISFEARKRQMEEEQQLEDEYQQRLKNSPYKRWIQLNKDAYKAEDWLMGKSPIAYRIFRFLMTNMDSYNAVMCSYQVMQEQFEVSKTTITRAIRLLRERQYIDVYKSGTSNVYTINKQIAWNSWGNNYKYGKFGANIILSESEQEEQTRKEIKAEKHKEVKFKNEDDKK